MGLGEGWVEGHGQLRLALSQSQPLLVRVEAELRGAPVVVGERRVGRGWRAAGRRGRRCPPRSWTGCRGEGENRDGVPAAFGREEGQACEDRGRRPLPSQGIEEDQPPLGRLVEFAQPETALRVGQGLFRAAAKVRPRQGGGEAVERRGEEAAQPLLLEAHPVVEVRAVGKGEAGQEISLVELRRADEGQLRGRAIGGAGASTWRRDRRPRPSRSTCRSPSGFAAFNYSRAREKEGEGPPRRFRDAFRHGRATAAAKSEGAVHVGGPQGGIP